MVYPNPDSKYCQTYENLKAFILKKNLDLMKKDSFTEEELTEFRLINEIVVKMMDLEWENYSKPKFFEEEEKVVWSDQLTNEKDSLSGTNPLVAKVV